MFVAMEARADLIAGAADLWTLSKQLETGFQTLEIFDCLGCAPPVMRIAGDGA
jgi:hypothetical protein